MSRNQVAREARTLTAADMMRKDVLVLRQTQPTSEAIELLEDAGVSGAPVLDSAGKLVGVLSLSDIAKSDHVRDGRLVDRLGDESLAYGGEDEAEAEDFAHVLAERDDYSASVRGSDTVGDWMNRKVLTIPPTATLKEVCVSMSSQGIHRLLVVGDKKLLGIVTTMDVVRVNAEG